MKRLLTILAFTFLTAACAQTGPTQDGMTGGMTDGKECCCKGMMSGEKMCNKGDGAMCAKTKASSQKKSAAQSEEQTTPDDHDQHH